MLFKPAIIVLVRIIFLQTILVITITLHNERNNTYSTLLCQCNANNFNKAHSNYFSTIYIPYHSNKHSNSTPTSITAPSTAISARITEQKWEDAIMHGPDIQSIRYTNQNYPLNGSLQTIHEQRSSAYQSQLNPSQNMIGQSAQGYNISEIQRKQYEKDKNLQEDAKCCFCFKKK